MRNSGWGLFALLVAILALLMTVADDYQTKMQKTDHFAQIEALTMPAIVPIISTVTFRVEYSDNYLNRLTAVHGKGVLARASRLDGTSGSHNDYAVETNRYTVDEPRQRSGPNLAGMIASFNRAPLLSKGVACSLARLV